METGRVAGEETLKAQPQPPGIPCPLGNAASGCWSSATATASVASCSASSGVATTATKSAAVFAVAVAVAAIVGQGKARYGFQLCCCPGEGFPLSAPARGCSSSSWHHLPGPGRVALSSAPGSGRHSTFAAPYPTEELTNSRAVSGGDGYSNRSRRRRYRQLTRKAAGPRLTVFLQREPESSPRGCV